MDRELTVTLTAKDGMSRAFTQLSREATTTTRSLDALGREGQDLNRTLDATEANTRQTATGLDRLTQSAQRADRATDALATTAQRSGTSWAAMGAATTTVLGVLSTFSNAAADEEAVFARLAQSIDNTGDSFDALSPSIDAAIGRAEDLSFADDQAAEAIARLADVTHDGDQALALLALTMDVARGRGISLAEASTLVGKVAGGNTAILARYGIVLEEGATAQEALAELQKIYAGQAETYGETTAGALDRIKNSFDNWAESIGASTGEAQTVLALLPGLSAGFTLVGGAAGKAAEGVKALVAAQRAGTLASGALSLAMGPLGLVAAGVGAVAVLGELTNWFGLFGDGASGAVPDVDDLTDAIYRMAQAGADASIITALQGIDAQWQSIAASLDTVGAAQARVNEAQAAFDAATAAGTASADEFRQIQADLAAAQAALAEAMAAQGETTETVNAASDAIATLGQRADDALVDEAKLFTDLTERLRQLKAEEITLEQFVFFLNDMITNFDAWYVVLPTGTDAINEQTTAVKELSGAVVTLTGGLADLGPVAEETVFVFGQVAEGTGELGTETVYLGEQIGHVVDQFALLDGGMVAAAADAVALAAASADQADAVADLADAVADAAEHHQAWADATAEAQAAQDAFDATLTDGVNGIVAQVNALSDYRVALAAANDGLLTLADQTALTLATQDAYSGALGFYNQQLGYVDAAVAAINEKKAAGVELTEREVRILNEAGDAQAYFGEQSYDATLQLAEGAIAMGDNEVKAQSLGEILGDTAVSMGELVEAIEDLVAVLSGMPDVDAAFALSRSTIQGYRDLGVAAGSVRGARGQLPSGGSGSTSGYVVRQDAEGNFVSGPPPPTVALSAGDRRELEALAGADFTVQITGDADDLIGVVRDAEDEVEALVFGDYIVGLDGDPTDALAAVTEAAAAIAAFEGTTASAYILANADAFYAVVNAIDGANVGTAYIQLVGVPGQGFTDPGRRHGGLIHAQHGALTPEGMAWVGEAGPELIRAPGGMVLNHTASRATATGRGGGTTLNFHAPISVYAPDPPSFYSQMLAMSR